MLALHDKESGLESNLLDDLVPTDFLTAVPGFGGSIVNAVGGGIFKVFCTDFLVLLVEPAGESSERFDAA